MEVNYLQNIKETHTLSLQTIVDLQSLLQDRESEIANLKMDNAKLGLELSKTKDEAVALKVENKNLEEEKNTFKMDRIAEQYCKWIKSGPFDIGITTRQALEPLVRNNKAETAYMWAARKNQTSMSNGALMRITPMAIYTLNLQPENARQLIDGDVALTHPSKAC